MVLDLSLKYHKTRNSYARSVPIISSVCNVTTILGIITAINEHVIDTAPNQNITGSVEPNSFPYPLCLSAIKDVETLVEVVTQHYYGDDEKWNFLCCYRSNQCSSSAC